jgi:small subunit ribosomal protein S2
MSNSISKITDQISLMSLFEVGAHRGNKKSKLNPRLKSAVFGTDKGITLIDLAQTKNSLETVCQFLFKTGSKKRQVLLIGTSRHLTKEVEEYSKMFKPNQMPYVNHRWLGGTLTNWSTIKKTLGTLEKLRNIENDEEFLNKLSKNERLSIGRKKVKIEKFFAGLTYLKSNRPEAVIVLDTPENEIAIREAEVMNIPVISLTNTATISLPKDLKYNIVCNISSLKAVNLMMLKLIEAYNDGFSESLKIEEIKK